VLLWGTPYTSNIGRSSCPLHLNWSPLFEDLLRLWRRNINSTWMCYFNLMPRWKLFSPFSRCVLTQILGIYMSESMCSTRDMVPPLGPIKSHEMQYRKSSHHFLFAPSTMLKNTKEGTADNFFLHTRLSLSSGTARNSIGYSDFHRRLSSLYGPWCLWAIEITSTCLERALNLTDSSSVHNFTKE
jgi:hypothetical protein